MSDISEKKKETVSILVCSIYDDPELQAAYNVILRQVTKIDSSSNGNPVYEYYSHNGIYKFMKNHEYGIASHTHLHKGYQIWEEKIPDTDIYRQESPVKYHYNYNVVTLDYTKPFLGAKKLTGWPYTVLTNP